MIKLHIINMNIVFVPALHNTNTHTSAVIFLIYFIVHKGGLKQNSFHYIIYLFVWITIGVYLER
jgi:hypothetical protein